MRDPSEATPTTTRVSEADVRRVQGDRDSARRAWEAEQGRIVQSRRQRAKATICIHILEYLLAARRFCDRTITREGGLVNALILGGALLLLVSTLLGSSATPRLLATVAGALVGAALGALLLAPSDGATVARIIRIKMHRAELGSALVDAREKAAEQERSYRAADELLRSRLAAYTSRRNQLLHSRWPEMTGGEFASFVESVFRELGHDVSPVGSSDEPGVDLIVSLDGRKAAISAKGAPRATVGSSAVDEVQAGRDCHHCQAAAVVTNTEFTPAARELAAKVGCLLIAGHQMRDLIEGRITV